MLSRVIAAALVASAVLLTAGCTASGPPEITVHADGDTITVRPLRYCDVLVRECRDEGGEQGHLTTLPGQAVQISVPGEVAETPWAVSVQSESPGGAPLPVSEEFFSPDERFAYTAVPARPDQRILVVEVRQLGAAWTVYADDDDGEPNLDERMPTVRGWWSVRFSRR